MNGIAEAVRQIRGTSVNQVKDVENVLVTAGTAVPTSGLILTHQSNKDQSQSRAHDKHDRPTC